MKKELKKLFLGLLRQASGQKCRKLPVFLDFFIFFSIWGQS
jgi:hypothetical protein